MASEMERLQAMYAELGDEHLRDLVEDRDELTDEARLALAAEMKWRGWSEPEPERDEPVVVKEPELQSGFGAAIPGVIPAGASAVEQALEAGGEVKQGMARLLSFYDGMELTRACEVLEEGDVEFAIEEVAGDAMSGLAPHFEIWVNVAEQQQARQALRAQMGLFPLAEFEGGEASQPMGDQVVAELDTRGEAEEVRAMLVDAGFSAIVDDQDGGSTTVSVPAAEQERALALVANRMGIA